MLLIPKGVSVPQAPEILIFFHIPKTGGQTLSGVLRNCFRNKYFDCTMDSPDTALNFVFTARVASRFHGLSVEKQRDIRCVAGEHIHMDVATIFDRPSEFITLVREPVDRVISNFYFFRKDPKVPCYPFIKDLTLEQYLDSGIGIDHDNQQVRMLSGCPELDAPWDLTGGPISTPAVEGRHLEMAKRNIEERFIAAAPLEEITELVWFLRWLYKWPVHRLFFPIRNINPDRPNRGSVSTSTRKRLEELNYYDAELYEWVSARFRRQIAPLGPHFSREVKIFGTLNHFAQPITQNRFIRVAAKRLRNRFQ
jgi:hypothetical protein